MRVGNPAKVRPELRSACLDAQVERTAGGRQAAQLREQADQLMGKVRQGRQVQASWRAQVQAHQAAGKQLTAEQEQRLQQLDQQIRGLQRQADGLWRAAEDNVKAAAIDVLRSAAVRAACLVGLQMDCLRNRGLAGWVREVLRCGCRLFRCR